MAKSGNRRARRTPKTTRVRIDLDRVARALARTLDVAIDPRKLRPSELIRLINSTPLGAVANERGLKRHRDRAGLRIGEDKTIDLLRYAAWLAYERHRPKKPELTGYDAHKEKARQRQAELSLSGRDIGELPPVADPERKEKAERDFRFHCETYFPQTFNLAWSDDHLKVIAKIERAVLEGGLFAMAMPRGSGKTSLCESACIWALSYGHRGFVVMVGADEGHAEDMLDSIKVELETNELLLDDFPEVVYPIHCLEGIHQRSGGQLYKGKRTFISWTASEIVLPTIPESRASGGIIRVAGITGRIRGMKHKKIDGTAVRPSVVLIDDPQTDESARSPSQCNQRERVLAGAILGLAGPGKKIAGLMPLTVVRPDDMADRILDREKHPQWQGERTKMVYAFPSNEALWAKYAKFRQDGLMNETGMGDATEFYRQNRKAMDEGAVVAWAARFDPDELSALQHAMNLRYRDEHAFWAEFQNEPLPDERPDEEALTDEQIRAKVNGVARGLVPLACARLTMFIDIQKKALFWVVVAWQDDFTGYVIDYGTEPDQKSSYFTLRDLKRTLARATPRAGLEGAIYAGLRRLCERTLGVEWKRDDGAMMRIDRCVIDANWGESTDIVYQFCRQSDYAGTLTPGHGRFVGASSRPFSEYKRKRGDRVGLNWRMPALSGRRSVRHVSYDTNYWKSFVHKRLAVAMGDPGCLSLYGKKPEAHRLLSEHLTAEYAVKTEGRGRTVYEWKLVVGRDNHWLDCVVGAAVAAAMQGSVLFGTDPGRPRKRRRVSFAAMQRRAQAKRMRA